VHDRRFVRGLLESGHEVTYRAVGRAVNSIGESPAGQSRALSVDEWRAGGASFWLRLPGLVGNVRRLVRDLRPDIVHAGPIQRGAFVAALAGGRPLVSMSWGSDLLWGARRGSGKWISEVVLRRSDSLVCDCDTVRQRSIELGMDPQAVVVFPWGVDLKVFALHGRSRLREILGWRDEFVLISARTWERVYGVGLVAEAFAIALRRQPALRLMLLGSGSDRGRIQRMLNASGAIRRVHMAGPVRHDDLPEYFRCADVYVSASRSDGSSITLLEAMASGLPAIVSDIPSNREWIEDGVHGWRFRDGDPRSLADTILKAYGEVASLKAMGLAGRRLTETRADWNSNFPRLYEAYALAQARSGRRAHAV
jgi:glycosyltransferase involved in cell wall biosynthesis